MGVGGGVLAEGSGGGRRSASGVGGSMGLVGVVSGARGGGGNRSQWLRTTSVDKVRLDRLVS